jgi:uncharacterized membrane protein
MALVLVIILTLLLVPLVLLTSGPFRIVIGILCVLFFPGYTVMAALFPKKGHLDTIERIALSFGLSIAITPLILLMLNYTPWGIRVTPVLICITLFILIASAIALYRRWRLAEEQRFEAHLHIKLPSWRGQGKLDKALSGMLVISIVAGIGALAYAVATPNAGERFTEFYFVGLGGMAEDYPEELTLGEEGTITVVIVSHEHQATDYSIKVDIDGEEVQETGPISLDHEGEWEGSVTFVPSKAGEDQKVELLLYKNDENDPYLSLHFWLDVKGME